MKTRTSRKRNISTEPNSDAENENPNQNPQPRALKRHKAFGRPGADNISSDFSVMYKKTDERHAEFEEKIVEAMAESTRAYERTSDKLLAAVLSLR